MADAVIVYVVEILFADVVALRFQIVENAIVHGMAIVIENMVAPVVG